MAKLVGNLELEIGIGVTWKYRTLLGVSREFVLRGKDCTARCLQRVAPRIIGIYTLYIIGVFCWVLFFNEDELQNVVGPHVASNVRYIALQWERTPYSHEQRAIRCLAMRTNFLFAACREKTAKKIRGELKKNFRKACRKNLFCTFATENLPTQTKRQLSTWDIDIQSL